MGTLTKCWRHFWTIMRHKWYVFHECEKIPGLWWQGVVHDLSKFSPTEFIESAKYFQGTRSPILAAKEAQGYALAWQHHKGHNFHHYESWIDKVDAGTVTPLIMPYKYVMEMLCDLIGAGKAYNPKGWTKKEPLKYFMANHNESKAIHPKIKRFCRYMLGIYSDSYWKSENWDFYENEYYSIINDTDEDGLYPSEYPQQLELNFEEDVNV